MNNWHDSFLEALYKKYPKKSELAEALMDLLSIERKSAYRRLRKYVLFTVEELAKIASAWDISLNDIFEIKSNEFSFKTYLWNYLNPSEKGLNFMRFLTEDNEYTQNLPNMECMIVVNRLPRMLTSGFSYLTRFYLLKWMYQYFDEKTLPFSQLDYPDEVLPIAKAYYRASKNLGSVSFVWDHDIFRDLVSDIRYFHSICLISDEEKKLIKKDLCTLLDYMSEVAENGCWPETGNKVSLHISHISIDTNYSYKYSDSVKFCCVHAFAKNEIYSTDAVMIENFRNWMQSKKKAAVQISEGNEKDRIAFFMKQRELVEAL